MNKKYQILRCFGLVLLVLLNACSGGGINISVEGPTIPPIPPFPQTQNSEPITAYGPITALSGITVNKVRYETSSTTVTINGQPGNPSDLKPGYVVTVNGRISSSGQTGTANSINFDANLIGPIESIDATNGRLTVMNQSVTSSAETLFGSGIDPLTFDGLSAGRAIQVSGYADAAGTIRATRIDLAPVSAELQLIGTVEELDLANLLFKVNALFVDYSGAIVIDLPGGMPANGMTIKVLGTMSGGVFVVQSISSYRAVIANFGKRIQAAGVITRFNSSADFDINGSAAAVNAWTAFLNGDSGDLALNAELTIDGKFAPDGRIRANRITFGRFASETAVLAFDFNNFTEVSVPTVFNLTVTQGSGFSVEVVVDADVQNRVDVTQAGSKLNIALIPGNGNIDTLHAFVTMPTLDFISLSGVVNASLHGFNQTQMTVDVGGVSRLQGNELMVGDLSASVSGVSQLNFGDIRPVAVANIDISGVSQATLNMDVGSTLKGSVGTGQGSGASALYYYGTNIALDVTTDTNSTIVKLGETKP